MIEWHVWVIPLYALRSAELLLWSRSGVCACNECGGREAQPDGKWLSYFGPLTPEQHAAAHAKLNPNEPRVVPKPVEPQQEVLPW